MGFSVVISKVSLLSVNPLLLAIDDRLDAGLDFGA
jgi:hypothetical protein